MNEDRFQAIARSLFTLGVVALIFFGNLPEAFFPHVTFYSSDPLFRLEMIFFVACLALFLFAKLGGALFGLYALAWLWIGIFMPEHFCRKAEERLS